MKFIEQIFGLSPDGGTGSLEVLLFVVPIFAALVLWKLLRGNLSKS
jgi:hypothetical protein